MRAIKETEIVKNFTIFLVREEKRG